VEPAKGMISLMKGCVLDALSWGITLGSLSISLDTFLDEGNTPVTAM